MNNIKKALGAMMAASIVALCSCGPKLPELPVEEVRPYFGDAAKTKAIDTAFYEVKDAKGNKLGTVLFSSPYSDQIKGFNGPTPLLIALDADGRIKTVALLENEDKQDNNALRRIQIIPLYAVSNILTINDH